MSMKTDAQPAVWLGCLSCNNSGHLVGRWFPCDMIEEVTLAEVHGGQEYVYPGCEEVLALDSEYLPRGVSKISQPRAAAWGEIFVDVGSDRWEELLAWYENCSPSLDVNGVPSASEFEEADQGCWDSFREFVESWVDDCGVFYQWPEDAIRHFDWDKYERDCRHDFTVVDAPCGGVFVFHNL